MRLGARRGVVKALIASVASSLVVSATFAATATAAGAGSGSQPDRSARPSRYPTGGMPTSARQFYAMTWGVDRLSAQLVESGALVRFSYRVLDVDKAKPINDRASDPKMLDEKARAVLSIPLMEKVGPLRQSTAPVSGKVYWMTFSNRGGLVKQGHRVSVEIGPFRVDGLVVQ